MSDSEAPAELWVRHGTGETNAAVLPEGWGQYLFAGCAVHDTRANRTLPLRRSYARGHYG
jgi:hypothetical protein